jgi:uncharacterized RDD family membrane protein YckC
VTAPADAPGALPTPGWWRRLACFLYEGVLLFGVVMGAGFAYSVTTQQTNAMQGRPGLIAFLFVVLGLYFTWFWSRHGQTLAMKTWHIRVVDIAGRPLSKARALARYLAAYLWFMPALLALWATGPSHGRATVGLALLGGVLAYAALALLHPRRQYWHDALCGTRLVTWRAPPRP